MLHRLVGIYIDDSVALHLTYNSAVHEDIAGGTVSHDVTVPVGKVGEMERQAEQGDEQAELEGSEGLEGHEPEYASTIQHCSSISSLSMIRDTMNTQHPAYQNVKGRQDDVAGYVMFRKINKLGRRYM